jgi:hypothetical protein
MTKALVTAPSFFIDCGNSNIQRLHLAATPGIGPIFEFLNELRFDLEQFRKLDYGRIDVLIGIEFAERETNRSPF